ncbi:unnamed protein product [Soboliphyme baturini]|uniref:Secreted protein n=1 Tax=Soboliphyme baturini TaxID=241478 RepID=A0A183IR24_9BILA|nr:unnamed protein product [Soboliphyme baturini]
MAVPSTAVSNATVVGLVGRATIDHHHPQQQQQQQQQQNGLDVGDVAAKLNKCVDPGPYSHVPYYGLDQSALSSALVPRGIGETTGKCG